MLLMNSMKHKQILVLVMSLAKGARKTSSLTINEVKCDMMHHSKKVLLFVQCLEMLLLVVRNTWRKSHLQSNTGITHSIKQWGYTSMKQQNAEFAVQLIATQGLRRSRSSVQTQHIYCITNVSLQKICKKYLAGKKMLQDFYF